MKKKIGYININVTYSVGIKDLEVSESVYNGLLKIEEAGGVTSDEGQLLDDSEMEEAYDWLIDSKNVKEADAFDWKYELDIED